MRAIAGLVCVVLAFAGAGCGAIAPDAQTHLDPGASDGDRVDGTPSDGGPSDAAPIEPHADSSLSCPVVAAEQLFVQVDAPDGRQTCEPGGPSTMLRLGGWNVSTDPEALLLQGCAPTEPCPTSATTKVTVVAKGLSLTHLRGMNLEVDIDFVRTSEGACNTTLLVQTARAGARSRTLLVAADGTLKVGGAPFAVSTAPPPCTRPRCGDAVDFALDFTLGGATIESVMGTTSSAPLADLANGGSWLAHDLRSFSGCGMIPQAAFWATLVVPD